MWVSFKSGGNISISCREILTETTVEKRGFISNNTTNGWGGGRRVTVQIVIVLPCLYYAPGENPDKVARLWLYVQLLNLNYVFNHISIFI